MINHFRTLLLNQPGPPPFAGVRNADDGVPGSEALPVGFTPVVLPDYLLSLRRGLFGRTPDPVMCAYRARQFLGLIQATELQEFVTALDPRLTYDYGPGTFNFPFTEPNLFTPLAIPDGLLIEGSSAAPDASGVMRYEFNLLAEAGVVTVTSHYLPAYTRTVPLSFSLEGSNPVLLADTGYVCRLSVGTGMWTVTGLLRPQRSLGEIAAGLESSASIAIAQLFQGLSEPYLTFSNLWHRNIETPYRLSALLCAIVYRTEEVRKAHG